MPPLNRTAIFLDLAAFLTVGVVCVATQAPLIQEDVLKRSQDALLLQRIPIGGVAVDGRDVTLSGAAGNPITSQRARLIVQAIPGVGSVQTRVLSARSQAANPPADLQGPSNTADSTLLDPATNEEQRRIQTEIDRLLDGQSITFAPDSSVLTSDSQVVLDKIATYLTQSPNLTCEIRGYDSHPWEARQNWVLALQRALSTEDYLEGKGIPEWRLSTHAFQIGEGTQGRRTDRVIDLVVKAR